MLILMLDKYTQDKRTFFIADAPRGGGNGGNDPHEYDDFLAASFKLALARTMSSSTPNPPGLLENVEKILERLKQAGHYILVSQDLIPIAKRLSDIPGYSDKRNADILRDRFKNFDLSVDPNYLAPPEV